MSCAAAQGLRWGERLEYVAEAGPGDFIYVPPYIPHQEINAKPDETLECVLVPFGQQGGGCEHHRCRPDREA